MRRLYVTHNGAELAMALALAEGVALAAYCAWTAEPVVVKVIFAAFAVASAICCYVFLFQMPGSVARRRAAEKEEV